jgi:hypothetical protein
MGSDTPVLCFPSPNQHGKPTYVDIDVSEQTPPQTLLIFQKSFTAP